MIQIKHRTELWVKEAVYDFCRPLNIYVHLIPESKDEDAGFYFAKP